MARGDRNYRREYELFQSSEKAKKDRASRNAARRELESQGCVRKGDKKDVHHKNGRPTDNRQSNLAVVSRSKNRSMK